MCGRFSQAMTREDYLSLIADEAARNIVYDPAPIGRYNVAPGTRVLLFRYCASSPVRGQARSHDCGERYLNHHG